MNSFNLTYKRKKELFLILLLLLLLLSYKKVFRNTFNQILNYTSKDLITNKISNIDGSLEELNQKVKILDALLGEDSFNENFIQHEILEFLSKKAKINKVEVVLLDVPHYYKEKDYLLVSNAFTLKGDYNHLIKTVHEVEKELKKAKLNSVNFYKKKNYSTRKDELFVKLLFQNFKRIEG